MHSLRRLLCSTQLTTRTYKLTPRPSRLYSTGRGAPETVPAHYPPGSHEHFKYRVGTARIGGDAAMKKIEQEMKENAEKGDKDKNEKVIADVLKETQRMVPLGFHSKWLWRLAREHCGDGFAVKYLLENRKLGENWFLMVPPREMKLWQDCVDELLTTAKKSLAAGQVTISDLFDCLCLMYVDTEPRNKLNYLENSISGATPPHCSEKFKLLQDNIDDKYLAELYTEAASNKAFMELCTEEEFLCALGEALPRMNIEDRLRVTTLIDVESKKRTQKERIVQV